MVKIVVRKERDIVLAYLKGLGFDKDFDPAAFLAEHPELNGQEEDLPQLLDSLVYAAAAKVLPPELSRSKATALYKALYAELDGVAQWGTAPLSAGYDNAQYREAVRSRLFKAVPECCFSEMPRQVLEPFKPSWAHKLKSFLKICGEKKHD